ncbi:KH domain-containing protein [Patescibacteria group bacterium]|nr:KH domain-containing protein [Patescibacteria group bacterium]
MTEPQDFLEYIVKGLVDNPNDVTVTKTIDDMGVLLTLDVNPEDMGQIIGRQGATAKALRTLVRVCGMKSQARVNVKINEPNKEEPAE